MKAYKSNLKIDELNLLKDDFFSMKIKSEGILWKQIRTACLVDPARAENMLVALKLTPLNGCMNLLTDENEHLMPVPNFCINDPYLEKHIQIADENYQPKKLTVSFCYKVTIYRLNYRMSISKS